MTDTSLNNTRMGTTRRRDAAVSAQESAPPKRSGLQNIHKPSLLIVLFVIALVLPNYFFLGPLRLSLYRTILLIMAVPLIFQWLSGRAGGYKLIDFMILFHGIWIMITLFIHHGMSEFQISGVLALETVIPFLLARIYIRTPEDFAYFIKAVCWAIALMMPLAFVEAMTGRIIISDILGAISPVYPDLQNEERLGMQRAQGPFEHPILFGIFCAALFSGAILVWGHNVSGFGRTLRGAAVGLATFFSLSMGAYISLMIQIGLLIWNRMLRQIPSRWTILILGFVAIYVGIDILSDRSPINVIVSKLTFRGGASYNRILIWEFGTAEVYRNPLFGIGFRDWIRPHWMVPSVDNFWLLTAMKFGLPALVVILVPFIMGIYKTAKRDFGDNVMLNNYRMGYIFGMVGFMLSLCTVTVWNATLVFMVFFLGSGIWMWDYKPPKDGEEDTDGDGDMPAPAEGIEEKPKYQSARTRLPRNARAQATRKRGPTRSPTRTRS